MYYCAGNFWWQNPFISPAPAVTIINKNIKDVAAFSYPTDPTDMVKSIQHEVVIAVPSPGFDPLAHVGALTRVSPCEYVLAAIEACGAAIEAGAYDEVVASWRKAFTSTIFCFRVIGMDQVRFEAMNLREKTINDAAVVTWTALQKIQVVMNEAALMTAPTAAKVAATFEKKVSCASASEKFSAAFVDSAMTVHTRLLNLPICRRLLIQIDNELANGNPLNSVYKLHTIVSKGKTPSNIETILTFLLDGFHMGHYECEDMSVKKLREGMAELMLLKKAMIDHFMYVTFHHYQFPPRTSAPCGASTGTSTLCGPTSRPTQGSRILTSSGSRNCPSLR